MRAFTIITLSFLFNLISILLLFSEVSKTSFSSTTSAFFNNLFTSLIYALPFATIPTLIYITIGFMLTKNNGRRRYLTWSLIVTLLLFDTAFLTGAFTNITDIEAATVIKNRIKTSIVYVVCMLTMEQQTDWSDPR